MGARYEAYGWHVQDLGEDIGISSLERAVVAAKAVTDRPSLIIIRTHIATGAPNKKETHGAHGSPLGEEEIRLTKQAYGWPSEEPFHVPTEALEHFRRCVERGHQVEEEWKQRLEAYRSDHPELAAEFDRIQAAELPADWDAEIPSRRPEDGNIATRKASGEVIQWAAGRIPELVGGSADLAPSTLTLIDGADSVEPGSYDARNLHFGIREHAMGAIVNGLSQSGLRAYGATFLIFSDYMKGAMRIAAQSHVGSIFVFTHDSIGLGEDGPTHQPIEQLAHLRATPNLYVVRPADFNETALAWRFALTSKTAPTAMALSRQGLPVLDPARVPADAIERGAYVLRDTDNGDPDLILIGTGSEVSVCQEACDLLEGEGVRVRLVSMPCMERFAEQDRGYRDEVLPPGTRARVAVEAASAFGWHRWTGEDGDIVAMASYGASAPQKVLYEHFGFTGEQVAERARSVLGRLAGSSR